MENSHRDLFLSSKIKMIMIRNWLRMASPLDNLECTLIDLLFYTSLQMFPPNNWIMHDQFVG